MELLIVFRSLNYFVISFNVVTLFTELQQVSVRSYLISPLEDRSAHPENWEGSRKGDLKQMPIQCVEYLFITLLPGTFWTIVIVCY